ncbi:MAG TPA: glycosyltransferase family 4 protein [Acidimicrobiales bacterium]|nr:glycosyltransferase family 4 protein [Acidimicrobiales bacterium]
MRRLRILVFSWRDLAHPLAGGAEVWTNEVTNAWRGMGHEVTLFCAAIGGRPEREVVDGVNVIRRGTRYSVYKEARRFYEAEGAGRFDLVIDEVCTRPFGCPRFVHDAPVVAFIHQIAGAVWLYEVPLPLAVLGRYLIEPFWLSRYRDVPTATVSQSSWDSLWRMGLRRVVVVPPGHRLSEVANTGKEPHPTLLYVGRLARNKRPHHIVKAFQRVRDALPHAQLWVVGTGPMESALRRSAGPGVTLFGFVDEDTKRDLMSRAHALVMTSVREGWGLSVTEAAAVGTPTIAYAVPGLVDSVGMSGGYVVTPRVQALASELRRLLPALADGTERPDVRPAGVIHWDDVASKLIELGGLDDERQAEAPSPPKLVKVRSGIRGAAGRRPALRAASPRSRPALAQPRVHPGQQRHSDNGAGSNGDQGHDVAGHEDLGVRVVDLSAARTAEPAVAEPVDLDVLGSSWSDPAR